MNYIREDMYLLYQKIANCKA